MLRCAEAERDYIPTALSDRAFVETSEFPIEPFSLHEEREARRLSMHGGQYPLSNGCQPTAPENAIQAGFFDEYGNYQLRSVTVDYKDAWLESLPADMGNVVVSEGAAQSASDGEPQPQDEIDVEAQEAEELTRLRRRIVDLLLPSGENYVPACLQRLLCAAVCGLLLGEPNSALLPCRDCLGGAAAAERRGARYRRCRGKGALLGAAAGAARSDADRPHGAS